MAGYTLGDFEIRGGNPNEVFTSIGDDPLFPNTYVKRDVRSVWSGDRELVDPYLAAYLEDHKDEDAKGRIDFLQSLGPVGAEDTEEAADEEGKPSLWRKVKSWFHRHKSGEGPHAPAAEEADDEEAGGTETETVKVYRWPVINIVRQEPWLYTGITLMSILAAIVAWVLAYDRFHRLTYEVIYALAAFFIFWIAFGVISTIWGIISPVEE